MVVSICMGHRVLFEVQTQMNFIYLTHTIIELLVIHQEAF